MPVRIGLRDVYYALLTQDDITLGVTYSAPVRMIGAITANINPNSSIETLFADDGPMETASTIGQIELELNLADIPLDVRAVLLGHTYVVATGELVEKSSDIPPWLAIGFRSLKTNGDYRYVWLVKGKFMIPEDEHETKGDSITFQTPSISGSFVKRDYDDVYRKMGDEDDAAFNPATWFTAAVIAS